MKCCFVDAVDVLPDFSVFLGQVTYLIQFTIDMQLLKENDNQEDRNKEIHFIVMVVGFDSFAPG